MCFGRLISSFLMFLVVSYFFPYGVDWAYVYDKFIHVGVYVATALYTVMTKSNK